MNKKEAKSRGWVKNVAIVFLAVLAVLTFFSNTILNRSLPEVSGVNAYGGEISTAVRISGQVEASDAYFVSLAGTAPRQIKSILVRAGDDVEAGQVLFELEPLDTDNEAVRQAQKAVQAARDAYQSELIGYASTDFETQVQIDAAEDALDDARGKQNKLALSQAQLASATNTYTYAKERAAKIDQDLKDIDQQIADTTAGAGYTVDQKAKLEKLTLDVTNTQNALDDAEFNLTWTQTVFPGDAQKTAEAQREVDNCKLSLASAKKLLADFQKTLDYGSDKEIEKLTAKKTLKTAEKRTADKDLLTARETLLKLQIDTGIAPAATTEPVVITPEEATKKAAETVKAAEIALEKLTIGSGVTSAGRELRLRQLRQAIEDAEFALGKLLGTEGEQSDEVKTRYGGRVISISDVYVGKEVKPAENMAQVEINGKGFTLSKSVTNAEAQRVHIGDIGQISSWGMNNVVLTLAAIKTDPKAPSTNKILEFDVDGEVQSTQTLEFTIGTRSQYYDMIVPNAAVRPSQNGKMVLVATAKSTPLGTRYIATQVEVEVIDSDSTNSAIRSTSGDLGWSPFVITTANKPVEANSQVRLAG
ncbi:MAG: HlyD family secretion protein [Oscillospiraceae bacterium]|jgi:multidrug efflux pump subunit AcrA (membrane-fusion protein)|nr:HlyD family secretion protein [Oscillospiraceae bacterium]